MSSLTPLRVIQFRAGYNLPVDVGAEMGHFAKQGLEVEITYTPNSTYLAERLEAGDFDIGHTSADDVIAEVEGKTIGMMGGSDLFLFMGLHSGMLSLVGAPGSVDLESLRGKSLAVDSKITGFVFILEKMLRGSGISPEEYDLVEVGGWESRYESLLRGEHAGTLLTEPFLGDAIEAGCQLIACGSQFVPVYQATCGATTRSWARNHRDVLVRYIRAYLESTRWCFEPSNRQVCLRLLEERSGMERTGAERTLALLLDSEEGLTPDAALNLQGIAVALELRSEMGHLDGQVPGPEKYVDNGYYQEAIEG